MNTIWSIWNTLVAETPIETNANPMPSKVSADPIVQSVSIEKPSSYVGAAVGSEPETSKSKANFRSLFSENVCEGVKFSILRMVVEMDVLKESLTIGVPLIEGTRFTIETVTIEYEWKPPRCDLCKIFGHVHDHCPKKVSIPPSVVTSNIVHLLRSTSAPKKGATNAGNASKSSSMLKTTGTSSEKGKFTTSNSYSALDDESEEDVENVTYSSLLCDAWGDLEQR
ncbi:hypothetical protein Tco_1066932 [Tanacetum coccineum]|uniref:Zinc knuckle CX2CX4HX4C n=1 Tax=Tanacetum coccineum TaxID=301880 RepID=A0ABQ5HD77_9ASTR